VDGVEATDGHAEEQADCTRQKNKRGGAAEDELVTSLTTVTVITESQVSCTQTQTRSQDA
jgi:hypothetical protein